ncbi:hypothetical protein NC651_002693 [Populus alba x Populus x berolinensis]|nr:hypothetical protein NC651_002693 [Populus alba x Populus x berolinensis]
MLAKEESVFVLFIPLLFPNLADTHHSVSLSIESGNITRWNPSNPLPYSLSQAKSVAHLCSEQALLSLYIEIQAAKPQSDFNRLYLYWIP